ncbi:MAG: fatty acid desaturase, partial [Pseudomonadota bacterium]|nr:fatty acid desaturase [Pseudomonadota bacterium]
KIVMPYQGMVAWPSVFLGLGLVSAFLAVCALGATGVIPLWVGLILNSLILYAIQTPLHEACHGNIAGRDSRLMWLNHLIGYLCGACLLHEYRAFRHMHLMHHRDTNDEELDPDHWVDVKHPLNVLFRCLTIVPYYHHFFFKRVALRPDQPTNFKVTVHVLAAYFVLYGIAYWLSVFGYWREVLALWLVPHWLGSALIIYFFAYLTHQPHVTKERFRDTNVFWVRGKVLEPLVNWTYLFQNFHLIHHLFPRIPFYLYGRVFRDLRPVLDRAGSRIFEFGRTAPEARPPVNPASTAQG